MLQTVENYWSEVKLTLKPYKDIGDTFVLGDIDEIL